MSHFEINFDARKILVDDQWYTLEDLGNQIKESIARGNYKIKKWSEASEQLQTILENSKKISFIIPSPLYNNYLELSQRKQVRLEVLLKQALESYIAPREPEHQFHNDKTEVAKPIIPDLNKIETAEPKVEPRQAPKPVEQVAPKPAVQKPVEQPVEQPVVEPEPAPKPQVVEDDTPIIIEELVVKKGEGDSKGTEEKKQPPVIVDSKSGMTEDDWFA